MHQLIAFKFPLRHPPSIITLHKQINHRQMAGYSIKPKSKALDQLIWG